jgi:hypothetical protein
MEKILEQTIWPGEIAANSISGQPEGNRLDNKLDSSDIDIDITTFVVVRLYDTQQPIPLQCRFFRKEYTMQ